MRRECAGKTKPREMKNLFSLCDRHRESQDRERPCPCPCHCAHTPAQREMRVAGGGIALDCAFKLPTNAVSRAGVRISRALLGTRVSVRGLTYLKIFPKHGYGPGLPSVPSIHPEKKAKKKKISSEVRSNREISLIRETTINSNYALITLPNLCEPAVSRVSSTRQRT